MLLFQTEIENINAEVAQLQKLIAEKLRRQEQLKTCQEEANVALDVLQNVAKLVSDPAILSDFRAAVVGLFDNIKNANEELPALALPTTPTELEVEAEPEVESEPETGSEAEAETQTKGELEVEATTTPEAPKVENNSNPKPQEPAPEVSDLPCTPDSTPEMPKSERVKMNEFVSYEGFNGEIECTYVHFNRKDKAISWGKWLTSPKTALASKFEVQLAVASTFKYELQVWGLNLNQVNRLTEQDFLKGPPRAECGKGGMTRTTPFEHVQLDEVKPGDIVASLRGATIDPPSSTNNVSDADAAALSIEDKANANEAKPIEPDTIAAPKKATSELENLSTGDIIGSLLVPDWSYKVVEVQPNNKLQCSRRLSSGQSFNVELDVSAVYLIEKASQSQKAEQGIEESGTESEKVVKTPEENTPTSDEKPSPEPLVPSKAAPPSSITPEDLAELIREAWSWEEIEAVVAGNEHHKKAAWKLLSKEEQNHVLILKLQTKQGDTQSEPSVPSSTTTTAESGAEVTLDDFSYGDTIEVISARNGEERVGDVGIVRVVHEHGVTVESNGVLTYWYPEEVKLLVRSDEL